MLPLRWVTRLPVENSVCMWDRITSLTCDWFVLRQTSNNKTLSRTRTSAPPPPPTKLFGCKQAGRLLWGEIHQSYCRGVTNRNTGGPLAHKRFTDSSWDLHQGFLGKRVCRTVCPLWINGSNRMKERQYRDSKTPVMSNFYFKFLL